LLDSRGLQDVKIEATPGMLTDHYDLARLFVVAKWVCIMLLSRTPF
jgi:Zn-dependent membrane protease YugP